jgi:hypothetical protein
MSDALPPDTSGGDIPADAPAPGTFTVEIECGSGNEYDGRLGLRISAIFVILVGSLLGTLVPVLLARSTRLAFPRTLFFVAKYFGSGVIVATAFIHLLAPAVDALKSPCLDPESPIAQYTWPEGIALMTVFAMFFVEVMASRYDYMGIGKAGATKGYDPALDIIKSSKKEPDEGTFRFHSFYDCYSTVTCCMPIPRTALPGCAKPALNLSTANLEALFVLSSSLILVFLVRC